MCRMASFILTRTKVLWSVRSDSHEDIIAEHRLSDNMHGDDFVRVELYPPLLDYRFPVDQWIYHTDQDCTPDWYDPKEAEIAVRAEMSKWCEVKIINDPKSKINIEDGMNRIVFAGKVIQSGGKCYMYDSTKNKQSGGECWMYGSSRNKQSGGVCRMHGSSINKQSGGSCLMFGSTSNKQSGGDCTMHDLSSNKQSGGYCWMYGSSCNEQLGGDCIMRYRSSNMQYAGGCIMHNSTSNIQSGGECAMYDSSSNEQSGGSCSTHGPNCRLIKVNNNG